MSYSRSILIKNLFWTLLPIAVMGLIFFLSSESIGASYALTDKPTNFVIIKILNMPEKMTDATFIIQVHNFIRKALHILIFFVMGIFVSFVISLWFPKTRGWELFFIALGICAIFAASDEVHQIFTHRGALVTDVLLDCIGAAAGAGIAIWFRRIRNRKRPDISRTAS